ncbi:universal stress protein [Mesorhizobium sp. WSM3626]|uniref:universal stress protein n=1 Tax=Mesorhizobium sp. WSM3626 TaxID=1040987 RepID=UPI00048A4138|nr:universal stress protein [Mesorhizobium sp. WSM3626]
MTFKTVLCVMEVEHSDQDVRTAADLCVEVGARLSVLIIKFARRRPIRPGVWPEHTADVVRLERRIREIDTVSQDNARLEKRPREIKTLLEAKGAPCEVDTDYCDQACVGDVVRQRALYADLTVIGPSLLNDDELGPLAIDASLVKSGKPVLVVPYGAKASLRPRRMLIGWDSRAETWRVVRAALHLLSGAEEVRVALVDQEATGNGNDAGQRMYIATYLARHNIRAAIDWLPSAGRSLTTTLTQHAIDTSADMVVMGACGQRPLRARIFGGVTRWIAEQPPLPLFVAR